MPMMIAFDKVSYTPGSIVSGHVIVIRTKSLQKIKGLSIRILGRANRLINDPDNHNPIRNHKKETYFDDKIDIFGHDGRDSVLSLGETLFPFTFTLPPGLPSSFVWGRGNILYFVEAHLTRSGWKDDKRAFVRLGVDGIYDLNLDPLAPLPGGGNASKYVNHLLNKSGPFAFSVAIQKSGFLRGHTLPFQINVRNLSKVDAKRVRVSLVQEIVQDGKMWSSVLEEVRGPGVPSGEIVAWDGRLKIPPEAPPTNLGNLLNFSPVLALNYFIQVELSPKSPTVDSLSTKVPVIIGTIPLSRSRSRDRLRLLQLQNHTHTHSGHDEGCPMHSHPFSHTPSPSTTPTPSPIQSQFSPGLLIGPVAVPVPGLSACRVCPPLQNHPHNNSHQGIYRRLRNLQRRRRESPPPSYADAVGDPLPEQGQGQEQGQSQTNPPSIPVANNAHEECQPHKTLPIISSSQQEDDQEVLAQPHPPPEEGVPVDCSNSNQIAKVSSEGEGHVTLPSTPISNSTSQTSQLTSTTTPTTTTKFTTKHIVTVQVKCAPVGSEEDVVI